jgi:hypothetical protein
MTHQSYDDRRETERLVDITAADETHTSLARQVVNGFSGLLVLMITGVVIVALVLWKSP